MKSRISIIFILLCCTLPLAVHAQFTADLSPCPGLTNPANPKSQRERIEGRFALLQSNLASEQKMRCLIPTDQPANPHKQLQADGLLYTEEYQRWDSLSWIPSSQDAYLYDANSQISSQTRHWWDADSQSYSIPLFKNTFSYDTQGRIVTDTWLSWDDSLQTFAAGSRQTFAWNVTGELTGSAGEIWQNGDWMPFVTLERTIENGVATIELKKRRDENTGLFIPESRILFEYDDQQRVVLRTHKTWDSALSRWLNAQREYTTYAGFERTIRTELDFNNAWRRHSVFYTRYNEQNQILEQSLTLVHDTPQPLRREFYTYNTQGFLIDILYQFYNYQTETWHSNARIVYDVDEDGDILETRWQELDIVSRELVDIYRALRTYAPAVSVAEPLPSVPASISLYPNPAPNHVNMEVSLSQPAALQVDVFDLLGRRITTLADLPLATGVQRFEWMPEGLPAGVYFVRLQTTTSVSTHAVTLID